MIYLHDPHTEYTYEQRKENCWEGDCGNYIGMRKVNTFNCPHCGGLKHD